MLASLHKLRYEDRVLCCFLSFIHFWICSVSCGRGNLRQDTCDVCLLRLNFSRMIDVRFHNITLGIEVRVCVMRLEAQPKGAKGLSQLTVHEQWWILRWVAQPKGATGLSVYLQVRAVCFEDEAFVFNATFSGSHLYF